MMNPLVSLQEESLIVEGKGQDKINIDDKKENDKHLIKEFTQMIKGMQCNQTKSIKTMELK